MIEIYLHPYDTLQIKSTTFDFSKDKIPYYEDLEKFEREMTSGMVSANGLGLAANQIGITKRFFAIGHESFDRFQKPVIIWNPVIKTFSDQKL
jgi:peptide deformylase